MTIPIWTSALAAAFALAACVDAPGATATEATSTATEDLSVFDWSGDALMSGNSAAFEPAVGSISGLAVSVYAYNGLPDYTYLYWAFSTTGESWTTNPIEMSPRASTRQRPTLVPFNGFLYLFYASTSGIDQYMARFDPVHHTWTGSTLLPFTSLGAVGAVAYNGSLTLVRADPSTHQLMMRTMSTSEVFSTEQPIIYNTAAADPCPHVVVFPGGPSAPIGGLAISGSALASGSAPSISIGIGYSINELAIGTPALAAAGSCLYLAHLDNTSSTLVYNTFYNGAWGPQRTVTSGAGGSAQSSSVQPSIAMTSRGIQMVHIGPASTYGDIFWTTLSSGVWSAPLTIPNHQSQGTPSLAFHDDAKLLMVHLGHNAGTDNVWRSMYVPTTP